MNTNRTITFEYKGTDTGHVYKGKFVVKTSITNREKLLADENRRRALGAVPADAPNRLQTMAYIIGQLSVFIVDAPKWWKDADGGMDIDAEDNVDLAVYDAVLKEIEAVKKEKADQAAELVKDLE